MKTKIAILIFSIIISLVITDIAIRIVIPQTTLVWASDSLVGKRLVPNQVGKFVSNTGEYTTDIEINSQGWRDTEHDLNKGDKYRVLIIGDSFVENFQVPLGNTFFKQLENNLDIEVIAMGLGDTGTAEQFIILKEYGLKHNPDLVIQMFFTGNDITNNSLELMGDTSRPYFNLSETGELQLREVTPRPRSALKNNFRLLKFVLDAKGKWQANNNLKKISDYPTDYHVYDVDYSPAFQKSWNVTKKLISKSREVAEESGAKYVLVSSANNEQVNKKVWGKLLNQYPLLSRVNLNKPDEILQEYCEDEKLECWFMLPYFKKFIEKNPEAVTHFPTDGHWNQTGTDLVARFLAEKISED